MSLPVPLEPAVVRTIPIADPGPLPTRLPAGTVFSWVCDGEGLVGWGERARFEWTGTDGVSAAQAWWQEFAGALQVVDEVRLPGTGPVAFGSLAFDQRTGSSALVVPRVVLGRRGERAWLTSYGEPAVVPPAGRPRGPREVRYADGALPADRWVAAVTEAVHRIRAGGLGKVVLARDVLASTEAPVDARFLLGWLAERYPSCWTYCVDGLVGATPELLIRRRGRRVDSRVLAGTARRGADLSSAKERAEHAYAARQAAETLGSYCAELSVPEGPSLLVLPNVVHLATEIVGTLGADASSLVLAGALHPTPAVCGTPTDVALDLIPELERMDRGRYAGPVGWIDAAGDGDWGLALRGAQVDGSEVRMFAGCGIVAESDPERELAESQDKLVVMRDALEARTGRLSPR